MERDSESSEKPHLPQSTPQRLAEAEMKRGETLLGRPLDPEENIIIPLQFGAINEEQAAYMREGPPVLRLK